MKITTVLFDLDGTLLPLDQDYFLKKYFKAITKKLAGDGYEPERFMKSMWVGVEAMIKNDGKDTNENVFWDSFSKAYGRDCKCDEPLFNEFYDKIFPTLKSEVGYNSRAGETVKELLRRGYRLALATTPVFPRVATYERMRWAGLDINDFELITTYENSRHTKPNPDYYTNIAKALGVSAEECLMVGNDVVDDGAAERAGMKLFIHTDCLLNKTEIPLENFVHGGYDELLSILD